MGNDIGGHAGIDFGDQLVFSLADIPRHGKVAAFKPINRHFPDQKRNPKQQ